jgi:hypothetical protein
MSPGMLGHLSARDRRAVTFLVPAVALILLVRFAILPAWEAAGDSSQALETREKFLRKYKLVVAAMPAQETTAGALSSALADAEKGLLGGATPALQAAEVQQLVRDLAGNAGIQVRSVDFIPAKSAGEDYVQIGVTTVFAAGMDQLVAFLNALQSAPRILSVDQLHLGAGNVAATPTTAGKKQVNVSIYISGMARKQHAPADQKK